MKLKVLIIIDSLVRGGRERRLIELLTGFSKTNRVHTMVVILKDLIQYPEIFNLLDVEVRILERRIKKDPRVLIQLYNICKDFKPNILHSWGSMPSIYTLPVAKILGIKFINAMIANSHCPFWSKDWKRARLTFQFSNKIVANSNAGIKAYNVPHNKAVVIHNGFNFSRLRKLQSAKTIKSRFNIKTKYIVGMVGRFHPSKDYETFIEAGKNMLRYRNDITFIAVGGGEKIEYFKNLIDIEFQKNILFLGIQENVESIINIFNIGVLTTNQKIASEGISNSIMEYMALAKPVIASGGGGTNEIIVENKTGFIISPDNSEVLISKIEYLINNPVIATEMGEQGRKRIEKEFGIDKMVNSTYDLYKSLLT